MFFTSPLPLWRTTAKNVIIFQITFIYYSGTYLNSSTPSPTFCCQT
uniref:Uncharacterized protein n=1 Tax=Anguilla anguilla TaxID=7936 RepID=A0A0E9TFT9_ANGAN